ncbi:hypothetical protein GINT2_000734 [Glugoides intestinalis]
MYYDLNIDTKFSDIDELNNIDAKGFCMAITAVGNLREISQLSIPKTIKPIYTRINVSYQTSLDSAIMHRLRKFDIICIEEVTNSNIASVIKLSPEIITIKKDEIKYIKRSFINTLKEKGIYIEVTIKDALYTQKEKIIWMNILRRLIRLGCYKNLIISSGSTVFTELKSSNDICKILNVFGLSDNSVKKILLNSEKVLEKAAFTRYASNETIATNENEGRLKQDFLIDRHFK